MTDGKSIFYCQKIVNFIYITPNHNRSHYLIIIIVLLQQFQMTYFTCDISNFKLSLLSQEHCYIKYKQNMQYNHGKTMAPRRNGVQYNLNKVRTFLKKAPD